MDNDGTKTHLFDPPIIAQYIRLLPLICRRACTLRMELVGCELNGTTNRHPVTNTNANEDTNNWPSCRLLGANGDEVPPGVQPPDHGVQHLQHLGRPGLHLACPLRSAGQAGQDQRLDRRHQQSLRVATGKMVTRLTATRVQKHTTATALAAPVLFPQVDLESPKKITGVITQGAKDFGCVQFVSAFKVAHSQDGQSWTIIQDPKTKMDQVWRDGIGRQGTGDRGQFQDLMSCCVSADLPGKQRQQRPQDEHV